MESKYDISIVIVGFNAEAFLKLTLFAVSKAIKDVNVEVLFIDNSDNEALVNMVQSCFPFVSIIDNHDNLGFGRANNKGLREAQGKLALLLNPDTIVAEDTLKTVLKFYEDNPEAGAMGIKMIDGTGGFLRESKAFFPTLKSTVGVFTGLANRFPDSPVWNGYYAGHLCENSCHEIDVLAGAFMAIPRLKNREFPLFNEEFFMYGEDVDLSVRIKKEIGKNFYLGREKIIHFKGKTTRVTNSTIYHFFHSLWIFYREHVKPEKNFIVNTFAYVSIKVVSYLRMFKLFRGTIFNKPPKAFANINTIALVSENEFAKNKLDKFTNGVYINLFRNESLENIVADLIIFDVNALPAKNMIEFMDANAKNYVFGFLTHDYSHLVMSRSSFDKGQVIDLN